MPISLVNFLARFKLFPNWGDLISFPAPSSLSGVIAQAFENHCGNHECSECTGTLDSVCVWDKTTGRKEVTCEWLITWYLHSCSFYFQLWDLHLILGRIRLPLPSGSSALDWPIYLPPDGARQEAKWNGNTGGAPESEENGHEWMDYWYFICLPGWGHVQSRCMARTGNLKTLIDSLSFWLADIWSTFEGLCACVCVGWKSVSTLLSRAIHLGFGDRVPHQGARGVDQAQAIYLTASLPLLTPGITMCHQSQLSLHGTGGESKVLTRVWKIPY